jgi:hypothetical protein|tara:strand:- start:12633 stop:12929 length:297 start_codon:yes stop_codon:yes gene_type:complete
MSEHVPSEIEAEPSTDSESEYENENESQPDDIDEVDLTQYEDEDEDVMGPMEAMLGSVLTTQDGDTVCTALVHLGRQMEIQNKILVKLVSTLQKNNTA